jgi:hypothetical protein
MIRIGDGARYVKNCISLNPVKISLSNPLIICDGIKSKAVIKSVLYVSGGSEIDMGAVAHLNGRGSNVIMNTRAVFLVTLA